MGNMERSIAKKIHLVDYALLDATFFDGNELPGRDMADIRTPLSWKVWSCFQSYQRQIKLKFGLFILTTPTTS